MRRGIDQMCGAPALANRCRHRGPVGLARLVDANEHPIDEVTIAGVASRRSQDAYKSVGEALKHGGIRQRTRAR